MLDPEFKIFHPVPSKYTVRCQQVLPVNNVSRCLFEGNGSNLGLFQYVGVLAIAPRTHITLEKWVLLTIW